MNPKTFHLISLGCAKNTVDSESMAQLLGQTGYQATADPSQASVLIVNTCGFIGPAKDEDLIIQIDNWEMPTAHLQILDNLSGTAPIDDFALSVTTDGTITFAYPLPPQQSLLFLISASETQP